MAGGMARFGHVRALDGVRAMAVLLVVASHSIPHTDGGGIGVQIFFTLSGFLITSLLLNEVATRGAVSYRNFYIRRALRLFPALALLLAFVAVLPNVYIDPIRDGVADSRALTIPLTAFYASNFANALGVHMGYLGHTWSLAIEEQFYLLWPAAALWLVRRRAFKAVVFLIPAFALTRAVMHLAGVPVVPDWLPAQADQLLIGALLGYVLQRGRLPSWLSTTGAGVAALAVLAALTLVGTATHQGMQGAFGDFGGLTICGLASAVLIGHLVAEGAGLRRVFSWAPIVAVGRVSYGIYLFHFAIFQYVAHQRLPRSEELPIEYAALAVAVVVSWFIVERPALRLKRRFERVRLVEPVEQAPALADEHDRDAAQELDGGRGLGGRRARSVDVGA